MLQLTPFHGFACKFSHQGDFSMFKKSKANPTTKPVGPAWLPDLPRWLLILLRILCTLGCTGLILALALKIAPNEFSYVLQQFLEQPLLLVLNVVPVLLLVIFFGTLTGNLFYGAAITDAIVGTLSLANRLKCELREEPLYPREIFLAREGLGVLNNFDWPMKIICILVFSVLLLLVLGFLFRKYAKKPFGFRGLVRWLHTLGSIALLVVLLLTVYASNPLYNSFSGGNFFLTTGAYNDFGCVYGFCHYVNTNSVDKPKGYSESEAETWESAETGELTSSPVHVIFCMSETFTDLCDMEPFDYTEETDPLPYFHSLISRDDVISGHIVVEGLGGSTSNTEFDVITGIQSANLSSGTTIAFRALTKHTDNIFTLYQNCGYYASYFHAGYNWFYNREHVFDNYFSVDDTQFYDDMIDPVRMGVYTSDASTAEHMKKMFEEQLADGDMICNYTTTIQNHMYYTLDHYPEDEDYGPVCVDEDITLSEDVETQLMVYMQGLRYADDFLEEMITYYEDSGEPVLFIFYGDHFPSICSALKGFTELGITPDETEHEFDVYAPPYLIWASDEAQEILDWDNVLATIDAPENYLSAAYLGAMVAEITGSSEGSAWYTWLNQARRVLPVVWEEKYGDYYMDADGNYLTELNDEQQALVDRWRKWSYYRMRDMETD